MSWAPICPLLLWCTHLPKWISLTNLVNCFCLLVQCLSSPTAGSWWVCHCWSEEEAADISLSSVSTHSKWVDGSLETLEIFCLYIELNMLNWPKMSEQKDENSFGTSEQTVGVFFFGFVFVVLFHNVQNRDFSEKNVTRSNWVTVSFSPLNLQLSFIFPAKPPNSRKWRWNSVVLQIVLRFFPSLNNEMRICNGCV